MIRVFVAMPEERNLDCILQDCIYKDFDDEVKADEFVENMRAAGMNVAVWYMAYSKD